MDQVWSLRVALIPNCVFDWGGQKCVCIVKKHVGTGHYVVGFPYFFAWRGFLGKWGENPFYWKQQGFVVEKMQKMSFSLKEIVI